MCETSDNGNMVVIITILPLSDVLKYRRIILCPTPGRRWGAPRVRRRPLLTGGRPEGQKRPVHRSLCTASPELITRPPGVWIYHLNIWTDRSASTGWLLWYRLRCGGVCEHQSEALYQDGPQDEGKPTTTSPSGSMVLHGLGVASFPRYLITEARGSSRMNRPTRIITDGLVVVGRDWWWRSPKGTEWSWPCV